MPTPLRNAWRRPRNLPLAKLAPAYTPDLLEAPLRGSIVPLRGATVTFTRASTATVQDFENVTRLCKSGEARFYGLRRVENLLQYPQDFTNALWFKSGNGTGSAPVITPNQVAPDGTNTASLIALNSGAGVAGSDWSWLYQNYIPISGATYITSTWVKAATPSDIGKTIALIGVMNTIVTLTAAWQRVFNAYATASTTTVSAGVRCRVADGVSASASFYLWQPQFENVTGQSVQTPAEYVSNGVLSAPYHGANVDGVKYFTTKLDGSPISDLGTEQVGSILTNNGWTAQGSGGSKVAGGAMGSLYGLYSGLLNVPYQMTVVVTAVTGTLTPQVGNSPLTPITAPGTYTFSVTPTAGTYWYVDGTPSTTATVQSVSVKQKYPQGYLAEPSKTQCLANPDDMNASPWTGSDVPATDDGTRFRGRVFWKLTKSTTTISTLRQNTAYSAAATTHSILFAFLASANSSQVDFGIYGISSSFGADANCSAFIMSGPGTLGKATTGAVFRLTGLSTTVPTLVAVSRVMLVADAIGPAIYPDLYTSVTAGRAIYTQVDNLEVGPTCTSFIPNPATSGTVTRAADVLNYALTSLPANNLTFAATITKLALPNLSIPADSPFSIGGYNTNGYVSLGGYSGNSDSVIGSWPTTWNIASNVSNVFSIVLPVRAAWTFDPDGKTWRSSFNGVLAATRDASAAKTGPWSTPNLTVGGINNGATVMVSAVNVVSNLRVYSTAHPPEVITNL